MTDSKRPSGHAHKLVFETANSMAHELYDTMMQNNQWYKAWKAANPGAGPQDLEARFVVKNRGKLLAAARATLATMLRSSMDEELKRQVYEALLLDNTLTRGRGRGRQGAPQ